MEYRDDLANVLLSGLPDGERHHVVDVIHQVEGEQLRNKRARVDSDNADSANELEELDEA
jgi:hypothetical protein